MGIEDPTGQIAIGMAKAMEDGAETIQKHQREYRFPSPQEITDVNNLPSPAYPDGPKNRTKGIEIEGTSLETKSVRAFTEELYQDVHQDFFNNLGQRLEAPQIKHQGPRLQEWNNAPAASEFGGYSAQETGISFGSSGLTIDGSGQGSLTNSIFAPSMQAAAMAVEGPIIQPEQQPTIPPLENDQNIMLTTSTPSLG